ncbi:MAG: structural protein P5 [Alistipes putredinis]|nr:MAG: structural protein P5 [Alistipes putredinis]
MNEKNLPRGIRNRNPGNIRRGKTRYKGETQGCDAAFKSFATMQWGYRAIFVLLHTYAVRYGLRTIRGMISRYAPPEENDTRNYVDTVAALSKTDADRLIDTLRAEDMIPIVEAISRVENGIDADKEQVFRGWELFRTDY